MSNWSQNPQQFSSYVFISGLLPLIPISTNPLNRMSCLLHSENDTNDTAITINQYFKYNKKTEMLSSGLQVFQKA